VGQFSKGKNMKAKVNFAHKFASSCQYYALDFSWNFSNGFYFFYLSQAKVLETYSVFIFIAS
jgi:hypothetical protein